MTQQAAITQEAADRLSARLQQLYDGSPEDEQAILRAILQRAQGAADVSGHALRDGPGTLELMLPGGDGSTGPTFPDPLPPIFVPLRF